MIETIISAIAGFMNLGIVAIAALGVLLVSLLPTSPFQGLLADMVVPYLDSLNWVIPLGFMVNVLGLWLVAIALYYIVSIGLRWVKAIE